jgi:hypothetical protein
MPDRHPSRIAHFLFATRVPALRTGFPARIVGGSLGVLRCAQCSCQLPRPIMRVSVLVGQGGQGRGNTSVQDHFIERDWTAATTCLAEDVG